MAETVLTADAVDNTALRNLARVLDVQRSAHQTDGAPDPATRVDRLNRLTALLSENKDEIAECLSNDFGSRSREGTMFTDVAALLMGIEFARDNLADWMKPEEHKAPFLGSSARVEFQPKGVIGVVSPWNFPFQLAFSPVIGVLAAGNRAMIKPSELTPLTSELMKRLVASYFDEAELSVILGGPAVGAAFTALPFDHLVFTGGTAIAHAVARAASDNLVPLTLELGGKSPVIVGRSADLKQAAERIMTVKTLNSGQICLAPDHIYLPEGSGDEFVEHATAIVARMFPTIKDNPDFTSIINARHFRRLQDLLTDARTKGARIVEINPASEDFSNQAHHKIPPTLVLGATPDMKIMQEEIFGPLAPVVTYSDVGEVIKQISARPHPLALYYFGHDAEEERYVVDRTTSGAVTVNDCMAHVMVESLPFGGVGDSGMGAYHGVHGFRSFSHQKAIYRQADEVPNEELMRPPFAAPIREFLTKIIPAPAPGESRTR